MTGEADSAGPDKKAPVESELGKVVWENMRKSLRLSNEWIHVSVCWQSTSQPFLYNGAMGEVRKGTD